MPSDFCVARVVYKPLCLLPKHVCVASIFLGNFSCGMNICMKYQHPFLPFCLRELGDEQYLFRSYLCKVIISILKSRSLCSLQHPEEF